MTRSELMARVKGHGNASTEKKLEAAMVAIGLKDYIPQSKVAGIYTDFAFPFARVAVFTDGCFWHGCPEHGDPRHLHPWWRRKITGNMARDRAQEIQLRAHGWVVMRAWEHDLKDVSTARAKAEGIRALVVWMREINSVRVRHAAV